MNLRSVDKASADDPSIQRFISSTIEMQEPGIIRYNPLASDEKWRVTYVRHQEWESYELRDSYTVDISAVGEYWIDSGDLQYHEIQQKDFSRHHEVEVRVCKNTHLVFIHIKSSSTAALHFVGLPGCSLFRSVC